MTKDLNKRLGAGLFVLAFSLLSSTTISMAQTCVNSARCDELGFNKKVSDCQNRPILKCPFDETKVYCGVYTDSEGKAIAEVGDIMFSDKTFSSSLISGKIPVGVVFDATLKLVVNFDMKYLSWGPHIDIPELYNTSTTASSFTGKDNTDTIVAYAKANNKSFPAAQNCASFYTVGTKKGDWYLPATGELKRLADNKTIVNRALSLLKVAELCTYSTCNYRSSDEIDEISGGGFDISNSRGIEIHKDYMNSYYTTVRCIYQY